MSERKALCKRCGRAFVPRLMFKRMTTHCVDCMYRNLIDACDLPTPPELLDRHSKIPTLSDREYQEKMKASRKSWAKRRWDAVDDRVCRPVREWLWKVRYAWRLRGLLRLPWLVCWDNAGAALETTDGDLEECPEDAAEDEADVWRQDAG